MLYDTYAVGVIASFLEAPNAPSARRYTADHRLDDYLDRCESEAAGVVSLHAAIDACRFYLGDIAVGLELLRTAQTHR